MQILSLEAIDFIMKISQKNII